MQQKFFNCKVKKGQSEFLFFSAFCLSCKFSSTVLHLLFFIFKLSSPGQFDKFLLFDTGRSLGSFAVTFLSLEEEGKKKSRYFLKFLYRVFEIFLMTFLDVHALNFLIRPKQRKERYSHDRRECKTMETNSRFPKETHSLCSWKTFRPSAFLNLESD